MKTPCTPDNEKARLQALHDLNILDTKIEKRFDRLTRIAKSYFNVPIALVSLVDAERQWFKSRQGLDATETHRDISFCGHAILGDEVFCIPDTLEDERFNDNPLVTADPNIRFYAGAPLHTINSLRIGTLCIIDDKPRDFTKEELSVLRDLADTVEAELERTHLLEDRKELQRSDERLTHLLKATHGVIYACKAYDDFSITFASSNAENIFGYSADEVLHQRGFWLNNIYPDDRDQALMNMDKLFQLDDYEHEYRFLHADGSYRWIHDKLHLVRDENGNPLEITGLCTDITDRKATEEVSKQLAMVAEHTDNAVIISDEKGEIEWVNKGFERITGYKLVEVKGKKPGSFLQGPDTDPEVIKLMSEKIKAGESFNSEILNYHKSGQAYWLALSIQPVFHEDKITHFIAIESDISERKLFDQQRRDAIEELESFKNILDRTLDMIFMFDEETLNFLYLNKGAVDSMGYSQEEMLKLHPYDIKPLMPEQTFKKLIEPLKSGKVDFLNFETIHRHKKGREFPVEISLQLIKDGEGAGRFIAIVRDITARKQAESTLRDSESRISAIVETVVDGIITINSKGIVQTMNPAAEHIFGYSSSQVVGCNVKMLMPEPYKGEHDSYLHNFLETGERKIIGNGREVIGQRQDGTTFPMDLAVSEMQIHGDKMFTGIVRDITERKKIDRMKSEFVSTVSHELRTPLTSIRGALGLVLGNAMGEVPQKVHEMLQMANRNSERLTLLINDILDLEKIDSGSMSFDLEVVSVADLLNQALEANQGYAIEHNISLAVQGEVPKSNIRIDVNRVLQVCANLISNAIKFSPEKSTVKISVSRHGHWLRVSVCDSGPGIDEAFRSRIFQRFAQADSSDTREKGGTGLGLSVSKAIVEQLGGRIDFKTNNTNTEQKGSEFYFEFPEHINVIDSDIKNQARALICEDNSDVSQILSTMLEKEGISCDVARNSSTAKELLKNNVYQVMLLDLGLPDQHGLELIEEIKNSEMSYQLPIIIVSALANENKIEFKGDAITIVDWIQKPVDKNRLFSALNQALAGDRKLNVLHVEDSLDIIQVTKAIVDEMAEYSYATSLRQAKELIKQRRFDLLILDVSLPDGSGFDLINEIDEKCPVIIFSGRELDDNFKNNVEAVLTKSTTSNEQLLSTIRQVIRRTEL